MLGPPLPPSPDSDEGVGLAGSVSTGAAGTVELLASSKASVVAGQTGPTLFTCKSQGSVSSVVPNSGQLGTKVTISGADLFGFGD